MDVSLESKSLPSVDNSRKSYLQVNFQRLVRRKLVHLNGRRSLALPSVGLGFRHQISKEKYLKCRSQISGSFRRTPRHCKKLSGKCYRRIRTCLTGEVETPSSPIWRQAPDVKYPEKVERRPDRIRMWNVGEQNFGCEISGEGGTSTDRILPGGMSYAASQGDHLRDPTLLAFGFACGKGLQSLPTKGEKQREAKEAKRKIEDSSCNLLWHFWSTFRNPFSTFYIPFQSSGSQESNSSNQSNGSNRVRFGAETRKLWPSEDNCSRCAKISHTPFSANGVRNSHTSSGVKISHTPCVVSNFCMPYWIRDQEGRLIRIENPQDTELDICVNIMDPPPRIRIQTRSRGTNGLKRQISNFSAKENEKFHECWERYMEAIGACPHHGFDTWLLTQAHAMPCTICQSCDHVVDECPTMPAVREIWRNHPNFSWKPRPPPYQPQAQTQAPQQTSSVEQAIVNLSKVMGDFVGEQKAINSQLHQKIENVESSQIKRMEGMQNDLSQKIDNIQYSISRLTNLNTVRQDEELMAKKTLVKESNNQEEKSGKKSASKSSIEEEPRIVIKEDMMKKHMPPPFPQALHGKKEIKNSSEILEVLRQVKVNIPLLDMIKQVPTYAKFLKDLCTVKRVQDPGCPTISVNIGGTHVEKALLDLGASVNLLPYSVYKQLGLGGLKPTAITLSLADSKLCTNHPWETFPSYLNAIINCRNGVMQLTFGNMTLELNIFHLCKRHLYPKKRKDWRRCA
ncbi:hypothetical protein AAG906_028224 [Vitis piasezkii]